MSKIAFIYTEKYKKYKKLIEDIINNLEKENINSQNVFEINISKATRKKYDLYIIFSDDIEDFDINNSVVKSKPMLITSNLNGEYIEYLLTRVTDIIYSKNDVGTIVKRIKHNLKRSNV